MLKHDSIKYHTETLVFNIVKRVFHDSVLKPMF